MGYFGKFGKSKGIPFMDNAEKGNIRDHLGKQLTLRDYGFINGDNGVYACVCFEELPGRFYFMNAIFTEALQEIERDGKIDDKERAEFDRIAARLEDIVRCALAVNYGANLAQE
jgi:hypothetical protein